MTSQMKLLLVLTGSYSILAVLIIHSIQLVSSAFLSLYGEARVLLPKPKDSSVLKLLLSESRSQS